MPDLTFQSQQFGAELNQRAGEEMGNAIVQSHSIVQGGMDRVRQAQRDQVADRMEQRKMALQEREFQVRQQESAVVMQERQLSMQETARRLQMLNAVNASQAAVLETKTREQNLRSMEIANERASYDLEAVRQAPTRSFIERARTDLTSDEGILKFHTKLDGDKVVPVTDKEYEEVKARVEDREAQLRLGRAFSLKPESAIMQGFKMTEKGRWVKMTTEERAKAIAEAEKIGMFRSAPTADARDVTAVSGIIKQQLEVVSDQLLELGDKDPAKKAELENRRDELVRQLDQAKSRLLSGSGSNQPDPASPEARMRTILDALSGDDDEDK